MEYGFPDTEILIHMGKDEGMNQKERITVTCDEIAEFRQYLVERENAPATISKYETDIRTFFSYLGDDREISKERVLTYKAWLIENYSMTSVNSMLVAVNQFLVFLGIGQWKVKRLKIQKRVMASEDLLLTKEEYFRLLDAARRAGKFQLAMMMETICATGIRVSELKYFRVEDLRTGVVCIQNKGKYRVVAIPDKLRKKLRIYVKKHHITAGMIFATHTGKEKNRSNIWREMKNLSEPANVPKEKIFPHNLRHLFARTFYQTTRNLVFLADILGHSNMEVTRIYTTDGVNEWKKYMDRLGLIQEKEPVQRMKPRRLTT